MENDGYLFFALMYNNNEILNKTINVLEKQSFSGRRKSKAFSSELKNNFGDIIAESEKYNFDFTDYYEKEFGANLKKIIIIFNKKIGKKDLVEIKNKITGIEKKFSVENRRTINIDPGYVNNEKVVLASFKKKDFKEDLGNGIYAHKVLEFEDGKVKEFWHTFPDFKSKLVQNFFLKYLQEIFK